MVRRLSRKEIEKLESRDVDWHGNNAAFTCPVPKCGQIFIVSAIIHRSGRDCPRCGKSRGMVRGGMKSRGTASLTTA